MSRTAEIIVAVIVVVLLIFTALFFYDWHCEKQAAEIMINTSVSVIENCIT